MANAYPTPQEIETYIRKKSQSLYINPDVAMAVAKSEGMSGNPAEGWQSRIVNKDGVREPSFGIYQLNTNGGLGTEFHNKTGLDPADPNNVYAGIDYALEHVSKHGWKDFHGAANTGIGEWQGISSMDNGVPRTQIATPQTAQAPANPGTGTPEGDTYAYYNQTGVNAAPNVANAGKPQVNIYSHVDWNGVEPRVRDIVGYASQHLGLPLNITSGYRGLDHPVEAAKGPHAMHRHTTRTAFDLDVNGYSDPDKQHIIETFVALGATGIGVYKSGMIHIDFSKLGGSYKGKGTLSSWDWSNTNPSWYANGKANGLKFLAEGKLPDGNVIGNVPSGAIPGMPQVATDMSYTGGIYPETQTKTQEYVRSQNDRTMAGLPAGDVSYWDSWKAAEDKLLFTNQFASLSKSWSFQNDPNWNREKELPTILKDVPTDYWYRFANVNSAAQAEWTLSEVAKEQKWDATIQANGWTGFGSSMFFEMFNPMTLAGGAGAEMTASRLLGGALKATRIARMARAGISAAAGNVGFEAGMDAIDARRHSAMDYSMAAGGGFLLGGALGIFSKGTSVVEHQNNRQLMEVGRQILSGEDRAGSAGAAYAPTSRMTDNAPGAEMGITWADIPEAEPGLGRKIGNALSNIPLVRNIVSPVAKAERLGATAFSLVRGLLPDARGARGREVVQMSVVEDREITRQALMGKWQTVFEPQYHKWARANLKGNDLVAFEAGVNDGAREEFNKLVDSYVWEEDPIKRQAFAPEVKLVGNEHARIMEEVGRIAYERGLIKDIEIPNAPKIEDYTETLADGSTVTKQREVPQPPTVIKWEPDMHYSPLLKDEAKFLEINDKFAEADIKRLVEEAFKRDTPELSGPLLKRMVDGYLDNLRKANFNIRDPMERIMSTTDRNQIRQFLAEDMGITDQAMVEEFLNLNGIKKLSDGGAATPRLKRRAFSNEGYKMKMKLPYRPEYTGKRLAADGEELSIRDFYIRNADHQMHRYISDMSGPLALADFKIRNHHTGEVVLDGIRNDADWAKYKEMIISSARAEKPNAGADINDLMEELDYIHNIIAKNGAANPRMAKIGRRVNQSMFNLLMQNLGINSIQEVANTIATTSIINTFKGVPAMGRMLDEAGRSVPVDKVRRELEALMGIGHKTLLGSEHYVAKVNRTGDEMLSSKIGAGFDYVNGKVQSVVMKASGFEYLDNKLQIGAVQAMAYEFEDMAKKYAAKLEAGTFKVDDLSNGLFSAADAKRMRGLGMDDAKLTKVLNNIRKHGSDLDKWDAGSISDYRLALHRFYRKAIQQQDVGNLSRWLSHPVAKVMLAFRSFMLVGMDKQFLYGLNHFDGRQAWQWTLNMALGASVWYLYQKALSIGQKNPDAYMERKFGKPGSYQFYATLGAAGFARSGFSTVVPSLWDTVAPAAGLPAFNARTSGISMSGLWGAPFMSEGDNVLKSVGIISSMLRDGHQLSRSEINTLYRTTLGNHIIPIVLTGLATQDRAEMPPRTK